MFLLVGLPIILNELHLLCCDRVVRLSILKIKRLFEGSDDFRVLVYNDVIVGLIDVAKPLALLRNDQGNLLMSVDNILFGPHDIRLAGLHLSALPYQLVALAAAFFNLLGELPRVHAQMVLWRRWPASLLQDTLLWWDCRDKLVEAVQTDLRTAVVGL